jgi:hypothetical protein
MCPHLHAPRLAFDELAEFAENPDHRVSRLLGLTEPGHEALTAITKRAADSTPGWKRRSAAAT